MKRLLLIAVLILAMAQCAFAANLTVQPSSYNWSDSATQNLELWVFSSISWVDENGEQHGAGNPEDSIFTQRVSGVTNNTTTHRLSIPSFTLVPTRNALRGATVRLSFWIMRVSGTRATAIRQVPGTENGLTIPTSIVSATIDDPLRLSATFADLIVYNSVSPTLPVDGYYTRADIDRLFNAMSGVPQSRSILTTAPLAGGGDLSTTRTLAIPKATAAVDGYLSKEDFVTFSETGGSAPGGTGSEIQGRGSASTLIALPGSSISGNVLRLGGGTNINDTAWASTGATGLALQVADSSSASPNTSGNPSLVLQTWRGGGSAGIGVFGYQFGLISVGAGGAGGDTYGTGLLNRYNRDMTGFASGDYFQHGVKAHMVLSPANKPAGANLYGYNVMMTERTVTGVRAVGLQTESVNNSGVDTDLDGSSLNSTISLNVAAGGNSSASLGIQFEAPPPTSFSIGIRPKRNSIRRYIQDYTDGLYAVTGTVTVSASVTVTGSGTRFTQEFVAGDQVTLADDGVTWYEVATTPVSDTSLTLTTAFAGTPASGKSLTKSVIPMRLVRPSYITATDTITEFKLIGMDANNKVHVDKNGQGTFVGANLTANNNYTNKIRIGFADGDTTYAGIWAGPLASSAPSLGNYIFLYEPNLQEAILNAPQSIGFRINNSERFQVNSAGHFIPFMSNTYDFGDTTHLVRNLFMAAGVYLTEQVDPAAPGANVGVLYCRDNGAGKSQLVVRFPSGAVQVIATEP